MGCALATTADGDRRGAVGGLWFAPCWETRSFTPHFGRFVESVLFARKERGWRCGGSLAAGALSASRNCPLAAFALNEPSKEANDSEVP